MRLHRLKICAFGPYPGSVTVDFDRLGEAGLFLLCGPTGAGKTSVLDAVGFALYGQVPGERDRAKRLRSDHATADVRTEVQLDFTVGGRRFEVTRSPEQERPKTRGAGMTRDPARVVLLELMDGQWVARSCRVGEADQLLQRLVGMSARQFFQVVLLPQGDFARFLVGDAEERRQLLEKLFGTARFATVEGWLRERAASLRRAVSAVEQEVAGLAARIAQAAGVVEEPICPGVEWVEGLQADWSVRRADAAIAAKDADEELHRQRVELDRQVDLERRQSRRRDAERRRAAVSAGSRPDADCGAELGAARRALAVVPALRASDSARQQSEQAARAWDAMRARAGEDTDVPALRGLSRSARDEVATLRGLEPLLPAISVAEGRLRELDGDAAPLQSKVDEFRRWLEAEPESRADLDRRVASSHAALVALPGRRAHLADLQRTHAAATSLRRCDADVERLRADVARAEQVRDELRGRWLDVRELRLDGIAVELACELEDGRPCAVCGSCEHPAPALGATALITKVEEEAAEAEYQEAAARACDLDGLLVDARTRQAGFAAVAGDADPDEVEGLLRAVQSEVLELGACAAGLAPLQAESARAEQDRVRIARQLVDDEAGLARVSALRAEVSARLGEMQRQVKAAQGEHATLGERIAWLRARAAMIESAADSGDEAMRAEAGARAQAASAHSAAERAGFPNAAEAAVAERSTAQLDALEQRRKAYAAEVAAVAALLEDPELDVSLEEPVDVPAARDAVDASERVARAAGNALEAAGAVVSELERLGGVLGATVDRLVPARREAADVAAVADLAAGAGQNTLRMRLSAFVLAARLEAVAAAASVRLARMSAGRYTLVHSDALAGCGRRSGLGLLVRDAWCGVDRDTATLSGGEAFLASLALALGLADVVTAEAGGSPVETLFVDEGFGSLDQDTLEEVMDVLDGLREGNRVVGLVSHVPELRSRIPARVEVRKRECGSDLLVTGC